MSDLVTIKLCPHIVDRCRPLIDVNRLCVDTALQTYREKILLTKYSAYLR